MVVGSILGVLFVSLVRRVMVEDPDLPFPESVAASEIHKAGRRGAEAAKYLFYNIGLGALIQFLAEIQLFAPDKDFLILRWASSERAWCDWDRPSRRLNAGGVTLASGPTVSPAYIGVGYIIGPELASLEFRRRRAGLGFAGSAADLFPGPAAAGLSAGRLDGWILARFGQRRVALHRAAHRRGRHDGGRGLHVVPHAQRAFRRAAARGFRS